MLLKPSYISTVVSSAPDLVAAVRTVYGENMLLVTYYRRLTETVLVLATLPS